MRLSSLRVCPPSNKPNDFDIDLGFMFIGAPYDVAVIEGAVNWQFGAYVALFEINNRTDILPNNRLCMIQKNTDASGAQAFLNVLELAGVDIGNGPQRPVPIIIGSEYSGVSMGAQSSAKVFGLPMISMGATSYFLTDDSTYPTFNRLCPHDGFQVRVLLNMCESMGWTKMGVIGSDDGWSQSFTSNFILYAQQDKERGSGLDIPYQFLNIGLGGSLSFEGIVSQMKESGLSAFLIALYSRDAEDLLTELEKQDMLDWPYTYVAPDSWSMTVSLRQKVSGVIGTTVYVDRSSANENFAAYQALRDRYINDIVPQLTWDLPLSQVQDTDNAYSAYSFDAVTLAAMTMERLINWQALCNSSQPLPLDFASTFPFVPGAASLDKAGFCTYLDNEVEGYLIQDIMRSVSFQGSTGAFDIF